MKNKFLSKAENEYRPPILGGLQMKQNQTI